MTLTEKSRKHLDDIHGDLRAVVLRAAEILPSVSDIITFDITDGVRSLAEQRENVAKGVSKTLDSRHLTGHAVDVLALKSGKDAWSFPEDEQVDLFRPIAAAMKLAAADLGVPVEWGFDLWGWDAPHFQLPKGDYPKGKEVSFLAGGGPFKAKRYAVCVGLVLDTEGGFNPADPSMRGVTLDTLRQWEPDATLDDLKELTEEKAKLIYRALFWHPAGCDDCAPGLDYAVFDFGVHSGPRTAVEYLQSIVGTEADGIFGPLTRAAVKKADAEETINRLMDRRFERMKTLANWQKNQGGWTARIAKVRSGALEMTRQEPEQEPDETPNQPRPLSSYDDHELLREVLNRPIVAQVILSNPVN